MICLLLLLWLSDITVTRLVSNTLDTDAASNKYSRESEYQTVRIGSSCKDLPDCSRSNKKWKLFSVFCQELGKLCQLSLTILTLCRVLLNPEKGPQKVCHDRIESNGAVFCEYLGERLRRSWPDSSQTIFDLSEFRPIQSVRCTHLYPVSLN